MRAGGKPASEIIIEERGALGYDVYTAERDELFRDMTLDDMVAGIKQRRGPATPQDPIPGVRV